MRRWRTYANEPWPAVEMTFNDDLKPQLYPVDRRRLRDAAVANVGDFVDQLEPGDSLTVSVPDPTNPEDYQDGRFFTVDLSGKR